MWFAVSRLYNTRNYFKFRDVTERLHLLLGQSVVMMHDSSVSSVLLIVVPEWNLFFLFYSLLRMNYDSFGNGNMIKFGIVTCRL